MSIARPVLPPSTIWEYRDGHRWKSLDADVSTRLTDSYNARITEVNVTVSEDYSYDFNLRDMETGEYYGTRRTATYDLRAINVILEKPKNQ